MADAMAGASQRAAWRGSRGTGLLKAGKGRVLEYSKQGNDASQLTAWRDSLSSVTPIALASAARSDCKRAVSLTNVL